MSIDYISNKVKHLKKKHQEKEPFALCRSLRILQLFSAMGTGDAACKGFYLQQSRKQVIVINSDLPDNLQRIILAHEIGHAVLHRSIAGIKAFHDFALFDETLAYEYEANIFAAELLIDDAEVLSLLNDDISFFEAASLLNVPCELLDFKFRVLKRHGYKIIDPPFVANSDFLKKVR